MARRGTGAGLVLALLSLAVPGAARSATPRVVGGHEAAPGAYPFAVALLRADIAGVVGAQFCGGSLVAPAWVLTAAHCVASAPGLPLAAREIDVVIGQADLAGARTTRRRLLGIRVHPAFRLGRETASSDVALLRLRRPVALARVRLAAAGAAPAVGEPARVVGWGALDPSAGGPFPSTLREGGVAILADAACAARTAYGSGYDPATMLCAGLPEGGVDACAGDSGGPLVTGPREAPELVGVVSFGEGCADPAFPGVYARVAAERSWIDGVVASTEPRGAGVLAVVERDGGVLVRARVRTGAGLWRLVLTGPDGARRTTRRAAFSRGARIERTFRDVPLGTWSAELEVTGASVRTTKPVVLDVVGPPRAEQAPYLTAEPRVGEIVGCASGPWRGAWPVRLAWRWERGRLHVPVGDRPTRRVVPEDTGKTLRCVVTAHDRRGSTTLASPWAVVG